MELLRKLFKDEETVIGLCAFKKKNDDIDYFIPKFDTQKSLYCPDYDKNFFLL